MHANACLVFLVYGPHPPSHLVFMVLFLSCCWVCDLFLLLHPPSHLVQVEITLEELYSGATKTYRVQPAL